MKQRKWWVIFLALLITASMLLLLELLGILVVVGIILVINLSWPQEQRLKVMVWHPDPQFPDDSTKGEWKEQSTLVGCSVDILDDITATGGTMKQAAYLAIEEYGASEEMTGAGIALIDFRILSEVTSQSPS